MAARSWYDSATTGAGSVIPPCRAQHAHPEADRWNATEHCASIRARVVNETFGNAGESAMRNFRWTLLSATTMVLPLLVLPLSASTSQAGPCPSPTGPEAAANAALGPSARQSVAAQMHRQPTVASVAAAEKKVVAGDAARSSDCPAAEKRGGPGYGDRESK
jgi:hypothetical protein